MTKNLKRAASIIDQYAKFTKHEKGYIVDLTEIVGYSNYYGKTKEVEHKNSDESIYVSTEAINTTKKEAAALAAEHLARQLNDGLIIVSDDLGKDQK